MDVEDEAMVPETTAEEEEEAMAVEEAVGEEADVKLGDHEGLLQIPRRHHVQQRVLQRGKQRESA